MTLPEYTCAEHCPIERICAAQKEICNGVRGLLSDAMQGDLATGPAEATAEGVAEILGRLEPPAFDYSELHSQCAGPEENHTGPAVTLRCGSLAVSGETRHQYAMTIPHSQ